MRILLTNPRGFCAGVRMAIDVVDRAVDLFPAPCERVAIPYRGTTLPAYVFRAPTRRPGSAGRSW